MSNLHRQAIIDELNGRCMAAPVLFEQQQWGRWMRLWPRPFAGRRDALLAWLVAHPLQRAREEYRHTGMLSAWWALLSRQLAPPWPRDQRHWRWWAGGASAVLHLSFVILLVWVALVRSWVPSVLEEGRVAVRFDGGRAASGTGEQAGELQMLDESGNVLTSQAASTVGRTVAGIESVVEAVATDLVDVDSVRPDMPIVAALPEMLIALTPEVPTVLERAIAMRGVVPEMVALPVRDIVPRPLDHLPVVIERETAWVEEAPMRMALPTARAGQDQVAAPVIDIADRAIEMAARAPRIPVRASELPARVEALAVAPPAISEREIAPRMSAPPINPSTLREPVHDVGVASVTEVLAVPERVVAQRQPLVGEVTAASVPVAAVTTGGGAVSAETALVDASESRAVQAAGGVNPSDWSQVAGNDAWADMARRGNDLFDAEGRARLPGELAMADRGAPGGEHDQWTRERLAASGTWLKRPPYDYTPTSFDKYWVPSESLLAEWVRRGVREIEIPVPGTATRLRCVVSLLQFGGGCGLANANLNEVPARARAAPDIPFKRELQQDNGSL